VTFIIPMSFDGAQRNVGAADEGFTGNQL